MTVAPVRGQLLVVTVTVLYFCLSRWTCAWFQFISFSRCAPSPQRFEQFGMRRISNKRRRNGWHRQV